MSTPGTHKRSKGNCLLHADYHEMYPECWERVIQFNFDHPDIREDELINLYRLSVEVAMLDRFLRTGEI
jgi:hypothetical protein